MAEESKEETKQKDTQTKEVEKKEEKAKKSNVEKVKVLKIPLKKIFRKRRKERVPYSIRKLREFLKSHFKTDDIKIGGHLNEKLWEKGIEKPPRSISVEITKADGKFRAELKGFEYEEFVPSAAKKNEGLAEKLTARLGGKALKKQEEENLVEGKSVSDNSK